MQRSSSWAKPMCSVLSSCSRIGSSSWYRRVTEDVDVLLTRAGLDRFKQHWLGRGYVQKDGEPVQSAKAEAEWAAERHGTLRVRVTVDLDDQTSLTSQLSIVVSPASQRLNRQDLDRESKCVRRMQTSGAFILLTGLGILVFRSTFIGTFADFFTAFGWSFATDVGFARIVELFKPATDRAAIAIPTVPTAGGTKP